MTSTLNKLAAILSGIVLDQKTVQQLTTYDGMYLQPGDVVAVRSNGVPELRDHIIVVTGPIVSKPHGMRPETVTMAVQNDYLPLLDEYNEYNGVIALKFNKDERDFFLAMNGIKVKKDKSSVSVIFPNS